MVRDYCPGQQLINKFKESVDQMVDSYVYTDFFSSNPTFVTYGKNRSKYKFSRSMWYTVNISVYAEYVETIKWCEENFGPLPKNPDAWSRWFTDGWRNRIFFRDEKDYNWYMLRWSN